MRVIVFVNGKFHDPDAVRELIQPDDHIIAVNGGTSHALSIGMVPHVIIGDMDSLRTIEEARLQSEGAEILRFPSRKDETDLELALRYAIERGASEVILLAALGGRLDQSFANLHLLTLPELEGVGVKIIDGRQTVFLIRNYTDIIANPGDTVSILPVGGDAVGVTNNGLEWPLDNATLQLGTTRGISNVMLGIRASIRVRKGMLLCVITSKK